MHRLAAAVQAKESTAVTVSDLQATLVLATITADQLPAVQLALRYASVAYATNHNNLNSSTDAACSEWINRYALAATEL
jgi:hypothetical protein